MYHVKLCQKRHIMTKLSQTVSNIMTITGGVLSVGGAHKIRPRIIFITDGLATDESYPVGQDTASTDLNVRSNIGIIFLLMYIILLQSKLFK